MYPSMLQEKFVSDCKDRHGVEGAGLAEVSSDMKAAIAFWKKKQPMLKTSA